MGQNGSRLGEMTDFAEASLIGFTNLNLPRGNYPSWYQKAFSSKISLALFSTINHDKLQSLLQSNWPTASQAETEEVCTRLEDRKVLRRVPKTKTWNIVRPNATPAPTTQTIHRAVPKGTSPWSHRTKRKPGTCRKCEAHVDNVNRHNNKSHSTEECQHNVVKKILSE